MKIRVKQPIRADKKTGKANQAAALPLLLLPGMMCDKRLFAPQINYFGRQRPVYVGDLSTDNSIAGMAAQVLCQAPPTFALAGLSMGGIVAMEMLRQAGERIKGIALLDTNPLAEQDDIKHGREAQMLKAKQGHLAQVMQEDLKPNYLAQGTADNILNICMNMALDLGSEVFIKQSQALQSRPDQRHTLQHTTIPALVLMGEEDRLCPLDRHQLMATLLSNSELVIIPRAGHLPTLEQPQVVNQALLRWIQKL